MNEPSLSETSRVTLRLPTALLHKLDEQLAHGDDETSRSAAVQRLIETALRDLAKREKVEQYVRGWREQPQTEEEFGWMTSGPALEHLAEIPWEPDTATSGGPTCQPPGDVDRSS